MKRGGEGERPRVRPPGVASLAPKAAGGPVGLRRKTGGRKKGTPNKIKKPPALMAEAQAEVAAAVSANEGLQPLDYMLAVMRDPTASEARRDMMAKAAALYRHPQLQAVAHKHLNADGLWRVFGRNRRCKAREPVPMLNGR
jgi:hypothetical protein